MAYVYRRPFDVRTLLRWIGRAAPGGVESFIFVDNVNIYPAIQIDARAQEIIHIDATVHPAWTIDSRVRP